MYDISLLIGLPKPSDINVSLLSPEDAAIKLRQAATLRLNGAQSVMLHFPQNIELAVELLDDAAVLFDKAFRSLSGIPALRIHHHVEDYVSVPPIADCPSIRIPWGNEFRATIEDGVLCAEVWLKNSPLPLWWAFIQSRENHCPGSSRESFEAGFLSRLQQRMIQCNKNGLKSKAFDV